MNIDVIRLHDELLTSKPSNGSHDAALCPICVDFALTAQGVPACHDSLEGDVKVKPYGDVAYADEGFGTGGIYRFPIDTEEHARASSKLLEQDPPDGLYDDGQLENVRSNIEVALQDFKDEKKLADESADKQTNLDEGGKVNHMDTIAQETHDALLQKAVQDATDKASQDVSRLTTEVASLTEERDGLSERVGTLEGENERLNAELDTAQVKLKTAEEEVESLKAEIVKRDDQVEKEKIATERAEQVRNLKLFPDEYIKDKASRWAEVDEEEWAERVEEWRQAKDAEAPTGTPTDTASAMSGSSETENKEGSTSPRRAVLGLS